MVKRGSITVFLALTLGLILSLAELRTRVSKNGCGPELRFEWDGYWTVFFIWTI